VRVRNLAIENKKNMVSGVIQLSRTQFSFYSKSATVYVLIEMSNEMFDFDESSNFMQIEKCIHFVRAYLERCKQESASHELVFILYGRLYYPQIADKHQLVSSLQELRSNPKLTEQDIDNMYAFKFSHHTKVFQDVFLKIGSSVVFD